MEEKQIAEIDALIAPIFRAADAYIDFILAQREISWYRNHLYNIVIHGFCEYVIHWSGKLSAKNDYLLSKILDKADEDELSLEIFRLVMADPQSKEIKSIDDETSIGETCKILKFGQELIIAIREDGGEPDIIVFNKFLDVFVDLAKFIVDEPSIDPLAKRDLINDLQAKFEPFRVTDHQAQHLDAESAHDGTSGAGKTLDISL